MTGLASRRQRLAVAADGPGAAGKTTLAGQIASRLSLPVVRAGVDGFPLPRQVRYWRGGLSAESYVRRRYLGRYLPSQALYRAEAAPEDTAHIVIGNDDPGHPVIIRWQPPDPATYEDPGQETEN